MAVDVIRSLRSSILSYLKRKIITHRQTTSLCQNPNFKIRVRGDCGGSCERRTRYAKRSLTKKLLAKLKEVEDLRSYRYFYIAFNVNTLAKLKEAVSPSIYTLYKYLVWRKIKIIKVDLWKKIC